MCRSDVIGPRQVGDRARQLQHPMVGACRKVQLAHGRLHQPLARALELAVPAHLGRPHVGVGQQPRALEALGLAHARRGDALAHRAGWFALPFSGQLIVIHARHIHMDVDSIDQRAGESLLVARDDGCRTGTLPLGIAGVAAWAGMNTKRTF